MIRRTRAFFHTEAAGGIVMLACAAFALLLANSPYAADYTALLTQPVFGMELAVFVKDVLMAIFFFAVGMELKREMGEGFLATTSQRTLPLIAALGGIAVPALIYAQVNVGIAAHAAGWAVPTATDIAFAICVVTLLGKRVPAAAKIFLLAIAIYDDLAAILIIALFYSGGVAAQPLVLAGIILAAMVLYHRSKNPCVIVMLLLGAALWHYVHLSGIHSTVAGMVTGLLMPLRGANKSTPLSDLLARVHPWVAFGILPLFAFTAAGVNLQGASIDGLLQPLPLGIALGLFAGKQLGIFAATFAAVKLGVASLPKGAGWGTMLGISAVAGIGFTMSLFIAALAFDDAGLRSAATLGVLAGSLLSACWGTMLLRATHKPLK